MSDDEQKGEFIGALYTLGGIVGVGIIGVLLYRNRENIPDGAGTIPVGMLTFIANVMPFALIMYGFSGALINQELRLAIPSIAAVGSIFVFGVISQIVAKYGGTNLSAQDSSGKLWCSIPGLESVESPYFPTAIMSTCIISAYYMGWAWSTGYKSSMPLLISFLVILVIQSIIFLAGECLSSYIPPFGSSLMIFLIPVLLGLAIGGISFASTGQRSDLNPFNIPLSSPAAAVPTCPSGGAPVNGICPNTGGSGYSQQVQGGGDENTFVAELYKNGQLVTDSISS
jgi:hypothetical protein